MSHNQQDMKITSLPIGFRALLDEEISKAPWLSSHKGRVVPTDLRIAIPCHCGALATEQCPGMAPEHAPRLRMVEGTLDRERHSPSHLLIEIERQLRWLLTGIIMPLDVPT